MKFSKKAALKFGWETFKKHAWFLIGITLLFYIISMGTSLLGQEYPLFGNIVGILVQWWISFGLIGILIKLYHGRDVSFGDLFTTEWGRVWNYILGTILYMLIVLGGFILLIVPGIIWSVKYQYYAYLIVEKGMKPVEAIKKSGQMTMGHKWNIFLLMLLTVLISILGLIALGVGLLVAIPVVMLANVWVYKWLLDHQAAPEEAAADSSATDKEEEDTETETITVEQTVIETPEGRIEATSVEVEENKEEEEKKD